MPCLLVADPESPKIYLEIVMLHVLRIDWIRKHSLLLVATSAFVMVPGVLGQEPKELSSHDKSRLNQLKEGKEAGQGVAYLDDGTMIVVDNAKRFIGSNVNVVVTSVLQTQAGRMIFTRLKEESEGQDPGVARS